MADLSAPSPPCGASPPTRPSRARPRPACSARCWRQGLRIRRRASWPPPSPSAGPPAVTSPTPSSVSVWSRSCSPRAARPAGSRTSCSPSRRSSRPTGLRDALSDRPAAATTRPDSARRPAGGQGAAGDGRPAQQSLAGSYRTVGVALADFQKVAAEVRGQGVATVHVARPLSDTDRQRLAGALSRTYGREIHLNVVVDPAVIGGIGSRSVTTSSTGRSPAASTTRAQARRLIQTTQTQQHFRAPSHVAKQRTGEMK